LSNLIIINIGLKILFIFLDEELRSKENEVIKIVQENEVIKIVQENEELVSQISTLTKEYEALNNKYNELKTMTDSLFNKFSDEAAATLQEYPNIQDKKLSDTPSDNNPLI
jgi:seryl-tRNA synthetase